MFETVGAIGMPTELKPFRDLRQIRKQDERKMFGFSDHTLGEHIEMACHALGIDETRLDFVRSSNSHAIKRT